MGIFTTPKIDAHCHVLEPSRFPYGENVAYRPAGQEMGSAKYFQEVMACYAVQHALLVGPNSGYATDNRCLLDAIACAPDVFKGIAVVPNDISLEDLQQFKSQGVIGVAFNPSLMGFDYYANIEPLLQRLKQLDMWAQFQVENDLLLDFLPMLSGRCEDHGGPLRASQFAGRCHATGLSSAVVVGPRRSHRGENFWVRQVFTSGLSI